MVRLQAGHVKGIRRQAFDRMWKATPVPDLDRPAQGSDSRDQAARMIEETDGNAHV